MSSHIDNQRKLVENLLSDPEISYQKILKAEKKSSQDVRQQQISIQNASAAYTTGSTAAAGSGDFHIAKAVRRRAQDIAAEEKLQEIKEKDETEFAERKSKLAELDSAKTRKNRERRKKRKLNSSMHGKSAQGLGTSVVHSPNVVDSKATDSSHGTVRASTKEASLGSISEQGGEANLNLINPESESNSILKEEEFSMRIVDHDEDDMI